MSQAQRKAAAPLNNQPHGPDRKITKVTGLLLECPICKHRSRIAAADLLDGQELRCHSCRSDLVVARHYDLFTGRAHWELESLEDDYDDEQP